VILPGQIEVGAVDVLFTAKRLSSISKAYCDSSSEVLPILPTTTCRRLLVELAKPLRRYVLKREPSDVIVSDHPCEAICVLSMLALGELVLARKNSLQAALRVSSYCAPAEELLSRIRGRVDVLAIKAYILAAFYWLQLGECYRSWDCLSTASTVWQNFYAWSV
jgi:hypothetical protein